MRNLKVLPATGAATPVTGLGVEEPHSMLKWTGPGVNLSAITYPDGSPATYGTAPAALYAAGRT
jgi:hypothetical protein